MLSLSPQASTASQLTAPSWKCLLKSSEGKATEILGHADATIVIKDVWMGEGGLKVVDCFLDRCYPSTCRLL